MTFPCECPGCRTTAGFPYRVRTDATNLRCVHIDLRCRSCNAEWHVDRMTETSSPGRPEGAHVSR
jgi:hypothetical protein